MEEKGKEPCCGLCYGKLDEHITFNVRVPGDFDREAHPCSTCRVLNLKDGTVLVADYTMVGGEKILLFVSQSGELMEIPVIEGQLQDIQEKDGGKGKYLM